jgi:arylsulfatase A-like enzyme
MKLRPGIISVLLVLIAYTSVAAKNKSKPNIIFIFADDQCHSTIGALGNKEIKTPNLDKMVSEGVTFTHTFNMGAWHGAVCVASRTMLNTGQFLWRAQTSEKNLNRPKEQSKMWGKLMEDAGYETYMSGKWHVKSNAEDLFNHVGNIRPGMPNQTPEGYNRPIEGQPDKWSPYDTKFNGFWKGGKHWSEVLGDKSIEFIEHASKREKPFFMYLAFNAPHDPRQSPKEYVDMYPLENISMPEDFMPEYPWKDEIGCSANLRDEKLAPFPRTDYAVKVNRQEYYAIISHMDAQIGRIVAALKESGKMDNTYIFYTADHGLACGHHGLMGKQNMYDHSVRPPMMVVGPDIPKNKRIDAMVYLQDIMPSTLELANFEQPKYVEFNSLLPLLKGEATKSNYKAIYGAYRHVQRMVRTENFKLIVYPEAKKLLLFNLKEDPMEIDDISDVPHYKGKVKEMYALLLEQQTIMGDDLDLAPFFPELAVNSR